ncbi:MAG TPA: hypothetical protein DD379_24960 [Cyanobacteria bacterium UBA11162]|nr:hypothetical protein [Cyanobacteria bacterium UBA11162]
MKKITLTKEMTTLQLSVNELVAMKNALIEVCHRLGSYEFETRVNISEIEAIALANKLRQIIEMQQSEKTEIQFTYREIWGLQGSLVEVYGGISMPNFVEKIGLERAKVLALLEFLRLEVLHKVEKETLSDLIWQKRKEIVTELGLNSANLKVPRTSAQVIGEAYLSIDCRLFLFRLYSLKYTKSFSGIRIMEIVSLENQEVLAQSILQKIEVHFLSELVAYLEVGKDLVKNNEQIEEFVFSRYNYDHKNIFHLQVLSGAITAENKGFLKLKFRLNANQDKEELVSPENYIEVEDLASFEDIDKFTGAICQYLVEFYRI